MPHNQYTLYSLGSSWATEDMSITQPGLKKKTTYINVWNRKLEELHVKGTVIYENKCWIATIQMILMQPCTIQSVDDPWNTQWNMSSHGLLLIHNMIVLLCL